MGFSCKGEIQIPVDEWARFVLQYASTGPAFVSLGPPVLVGDELVVPYSANTECHPSQQVEPPECLLENNGTM